MHVDPDRSFGAALAADAARWTDLARSDEAYRLLVEQAPAIFYVDSAEAPDSTLFISPQVETVLGYSPDEWLGDSQLWHQLLHPQDRERVLHEHVRTNLTGEQFAQEYRLIARDGRVVWIHDSATLVRDEHGRAQFWKGVMVDVSHLRRVEQLERALQLQREASEHLQAVSELKTTFLRAVSHDMRTPLTTILAAAVMLERDSSRFTGEQQEELLAAIVASARKLNRLVTDLLDLDRLERGAVEPKRRLTDVTAIARRSVEEADFLHGRQVSLSETPVWADVDSAKVERIVENLLVNVARHTEDEVPVWVNVEPQDGGVLVAVEDAGGGVPSELKQQIFEAFQQGHDAHPGGVGVGLALVARFAELHDGRAWVEDRPGGGASFRVFLPGSAAS